MGSVKTISVHAAAQGSLNHLKRSKIKGQIDYATVFEFKSDFIDRIGRCITRKWLVLYKI